MASIYIYYFSEDPKFKASTMENLILGLSYADIVWVLNQNNGFNYFLLSWRWIVTLSDTSIFVNLERRECGLDADDICRSDTDRMRQILRLVGMAFDEQERILVDRVDPSASAHLIPALISTLDTHSEMNKHTIL